MNSRLRFLVVATAALATILVDLRDAPAAGLPGESFVSAAGQGSDSGPADDPGAPAGQAEEDDGEEEREIHLLATPVAACRPAAAVTRAALSRWRDAVEVHHRLTHVRGPPAR